ncbi:MAG: DUF4157 domain-containing protein [Rhodospirillales bacterium]|nr:DUF4157 domain-containing protein [Rhodospirillales bacterium]
MDQSTTGPLPLDRHRQRGDRQLLAEVIAHRPAQPQAAGGAIAVDAALLRTSGQAGRPLPETVQRQMEQAFGADFSAVHVHEGPQAESICAIAFTVGTDIYFAPGRFQPQTPAGQQLLGHELAHVLQQRAGRVRNPLGSGLAVVQDHALEAEADRLGHRAAAHRLIAQPKMARDAAQPTVPVTGPRAIGTAPRYVQRSAGRASTIQRAPCPYCGVEAQAGPSPLGGWSNGHAFACPLYQRTFETQGDRAANQNRPLRQRSYSYRNLRTTLVDSGNGLYVPRVYKQNAAKSLNKAAFWLILVTFAIVGWWRCQIWFDRRWLGSGRSMTWCERSATRSAAAA